MAMPCEVILKPNDPRTSSLESIGQEIALRPAKAARQDLDGHRNLGKLGKVCGKRPVGALSELEFWGG
jgi:hypothetical protein